MASKEKKTALVKEDAGQSEIVRRFKANPFLFTGTVLILIIVIVAFVFVPAIVPSAGGAGVDLTFGYLNKKPVTYVPGNYFAQVQEGISRSRQSTLNEGNYFQQSYQIWREAFEQTVVYMGISSEMDAAGFDVPPEVVDREVALLPQFQENSRFSSAKYNKLDNASKNSLWRRVRESTIQERYFSDFSGLKISSKEAGFISAMASPQRNFSLVSFPLSRYPDSEVEGFAQENPELFRVTHLSVITLNSSEKAAQDLLKSVKEGSTTFEDAARSNSQDSYAERGGDMGVKMAYELSAEIPDAPQRQGVIALEKDAYSEVVKVSEGWAFFRAEEAPRPGDTADSLHLEKMRSYLRDFERGRMEDWLIKEAGDFAAAAVERGFETAVIEGSLEKKDFGPLPINYGNAEIFPSLYSNPLTELASAAKDDNFWALAFSTPLETPSTPLVLGDYVLVLYPREEIPADESVTTSIENYYSFWIDNVVRRNIYAYFLDSEKLEDKFDETFFKYFLSSR